MPGLILFPGPTGDGFAIVKSRFAFIVLVVAVLTELVLGYGVEANRDEPPWTDWAQSLGVLSEQMRRERANNSLVFVQDQVGSWVKAWGRVHQVLPDGVVVLRETGGEAPYLWCAPASSVKVPRFRRGHLAVLYGQVVDYVPGDGSTRHYLLLRQCEFRRIMWAL